MLSCLLYNLHRAHANFILNLYYFVRIMIIIDNLTLFYCYFCVQSVYSVALFICVFVIVSLRQRVDIYGAVRHLQR